MTRVVRTRAEFEGEISEGLALIQDEEAPAWGKGERLDVVGRETRRIAMSVCSRRGCSVEFPKKS